MKNIKRNAFIIIGIIIGLINLWDGIWAMFVFSNDTKVIDWIFVFVGLLSFFPCVIVGIFWHKPVGLVLIAFAIIFLLSIILNPQIHQNFMLAIYYLIRYFLPMIVYGVVFLVPEKTKAV